MCIYPLTQIWLKFASMDPINNKPVLLRMMAWHWTGDKQLPEHPTMPWDTELFLYEMKPSCHWVYTQERQVKYQV